MYVPSTGDWFAFHKDARGSIRQVVDVVRGTVVQELEYSPFGEVLQDTSPGFQPFGFASGLYDHRTGLVRFGARDYDGRTGMWLAKDPIRFGGGTPNLYEYVGNDPVNFIDPGGESAQTLVVGGGGLLVLVRIAMAFGMGVGICDAGMRLLATSQSEALETLTGSGVITDDKGDVVNIEKAGGLDDAIADFEELGLTNGS